MPVRLQATDEGLSKTTTVFTGDSATGTMSELATDDSQHFSDFTAGATSISQASPGSDRFNFSHPRTIGARVNTSNTTTGTIFTYGSGGRLLQLDINVAGTLRAISDNTVVGSVAIPGLGAGATDYIFAWVSRANPLTTGASDAVQSWLYVIDESGGQLARAEFTHAARGSATGTARWGSMTGGTLELLWISRSPSSLTEIAIDTGNLSPGAVATVCEFYSPLMPVTESSGVGDTNAIYGPVPQYAARQLRHALRRHWSPLANIVYESQVELNSGTGGGHPAYGLAPGSTGYRMPLGLMVPAKVPLGATHAWVRLQVRSWVTAGAAVPLGLRIYSLDRNPFVAGQGALGSFHVGEVVTRDDTSTGLGQWDIDTVMPLAVSADGWTLICPAFQFDPLNASGNDSNARAEIRALHAVPCTSEVSGGA